MADELCMHEMDPATCSICKRGIIDQQIGSYLTGAVGRLKIVQVSPKGQSNAKWRRR